MVQQALADYRAGGLLLPPRMRWGDLVADGLDADAPATWLRHRELLGLTLIVMPVPPVPCRAGARFPAFFNSVAVARSRPFRQPPRYPKASRDNTPGPGAG